MAAIETSLANAFETQLTANVTDSDLTFPVGSIGSLTSPTYLVIDPDNPTKREYVFFNGTFTATDLVTTALANRGLAGSASGAQGHTKGAKVRAVPMQQHFEDLHDRMDTAYTVGGTDVAVADGGTGASSAPVARTNLGAAADAEVVHLAGAETVTGAKTFSVDPTLADGSSALSATEADARFPQKGAAETIAGAWTYSTDPTLADGSSALSLTEGNAAYVGLTGDQSVDGKKRFLDGVWVGNASASSFTDPWRPSTLTDDVRTKIIEFFGQSGAVAGTPQARGLIAKFFNSTTDDSAQADSAASILVDNGTAAFTQAQPVTGFEGDAIIQGANITTGKVVGITGRAEAQDTASVSTAIGVYAQAVKGASATITDAYGLYVEALQGTNKFAVFASDVIQTSSRFQAGAGGVTGPAYTFASDSDTGMYRHSENVLGFVTGATLRVQVVGSQVRQSDGSATLPSHTWMSDPDTGMYSQAANSIGFATAGAERVRINSVGNLFVGAASGGGGEGLIGLANVAVAPASTPSIGGVLYAEAGALKWKGSAGTVTTIAPA